MQQKRQIVLDTETTGLETEQGHRIIEIGCVELINRRLTGNNFHQYIKPEREIDAGAAQVHGITSEFLDDKPLFGDIVDDFVQYISGAELIIHNAPFDVGFINAELKWDKKEWQLVNAICEVTDTLLMARKMHPGQKNNLNALCRRYDIDNSRRELHGALLDAEILADVYLGMTGGQVSLMLEEVVSKHQNKNEFKINLLDPERPKLKVIKSNEDEIKQHHDLLAVINKKSGGGCLFSLEVVKS